MDDKTKYFFVIEILDRLHWWCKCSWREVNRLRLTSKESSVAFVHFQMVPEYQGKSMRIRNLGSD
ncbi:hypothetical protein LCGC14_1407240 [marine sediment metagenome]|uniref:Uncharacterized protein n=1 Tax=marine sediment metagenome TaxID=412755 RepID=A0A0F9JVQ3_9ZZZZ